MRRPRKPRRRRAQPQGCRPFRKTSGSGLLKVMWLPSTTVSNRGVKPTLSKINCALRLELPSPTRMPSATSDSINSLAPAKCLARRFESSRGTMHSLVHQLHFCLHRVANAPNGECDPNCRPAQSLQRMIVFFGERNAQLFRQTFPRDKVMHRRVHDDPSMSNKHAFNPILILISK